MKTVVTSEDAEHNKSCPYDRDGGWCLGDACMKWELEIKTEYVRAPQTTFIELAEPEMVLKETPTGRGWCGRN
jgi:hypothetical protein